MTDRSNAAAFSQSQEQLRASQARSNMRYPLQIKVVSSDTDWERYTAFLESGHVPGLACLGYHYPFYFRALAGSVYSDCCARMLLAYDGSELIGVLSGMFLSAGPIRVWLSGGYFGFNGGVLTAAADPAIISTLLRAAVRDAEALEAQVLSVYSPVGADLRLYQEVLSPVADVTEKFTQTLEFPADLSVSPWNRDTRSEISRNLNRGVTALPIENEEQLCGVYEIYRGNCLSRGIPLKPYSLILALWKTGGPNLSAVRVELNGELIAGLLCLLGGQTVSYYLPCSRDDFRNYQPNLVALNAVVQQARSRGFRYLNFESSPGRESGVFHFKRRAGGSEAYYGVFTKLLDPRALETFSELGREKIQQLLPNTFVIPFHLLGQPQLSSAETHVLSPESC